ncbi:hypothetical protein [Arthrobacter sp. JCM 19049]|uniref:hypothetical protein n=1 Tax=Arthrobacter sp. JCM 19049 TaxID=1460643 RepID=UPI000B03275E|nr:hypothetical protein [Arthrobacter sp. JCM 19049]
MAEHPDPRLEDESRLDKIKRVVEDVAHDAPPLAKIALEAMIRNHNPDLAGTAETAGRLACALAKCPS